MRRPVAAAAVLSLCLLSTSSNLAQGSGAPSHVLLITLDTVRADRLGAYGYAKALTPVLDGLARRGVRFADATSAAPLTYPAHVAILTGRYPGAYGARLNGGPPLPDGAVTLAERFKAAGFETGAILGSVVLDKSTGLTQGFDTYDDEIEWRTAESVALADLQRPAGEVVRRARAWMDARKGRRWFLWVHLYDAHLPYDAPARYQKLTGGRLYDAEIAYVDASLGTLLAGIDRASTLIAVVGDHGEALGDHGEGDHGFFIYDATLKVPFLLAGPGVSPRVVARQVRTVDVPATIAALASLPGQEGGDGASLVRTMQGETGDAAPAYAETWYPRLHFGWSELRSIRVGEWKYIAAPVPELYDLRVDSGELKNVAGQRAAVAGRLASELARLVAAQGSGASQPAAAQPDPETVKRLQALGYVGSFAPTSAGAATEDPKTHVDEYIAYRRRFNGALGALGRGDYQRAVGVLQELLTLNVRAFEAHLYLGNAYAGLQKYDAALGEYDAAAQLNPEFAQPHFEAAKVLMMRGDTTGAARRAQLGLERDPNDFYGHYTLGVLYLKGGQAVEAVTALRRAVELNGANGAARANLASAAMRIGALDLAREQLERMIALGFDIAAAHFNLGVIAARHGNRAEAERRYRLALKADPGFRPASDALKRLR